MTKTVKKNRKLKRQVRKTIGGLFMASAIVIAALPVQDVSANPGEAAKPAPKVWVWDSQGKRTGDLAGTPDSSIKSFCESTIPYVPDDATIYTSGDGRFQFAYVNPGDGVRSAVILNYNSTVLQDSTLTIPNSLEAFRKYKTTQTEGGYCLVTQNDEVMFYDVYEQDYVMDGSSQVLLYYVPNIKYDTNKHPVPAGSSYNVGESIVVNKNQLVTRNDKLVYIDPTDPYEYDDDGNVIGEKLFDVTERMVTHQKPCYYEQRSIWGEQDDNKLYYQVKNSVTKDKPNGDLIHPTDNDHYRIEASVKYIGQQFIDTNTVDGTWSVRKNAYRTGPDDGVFANNANITNLVIGENLSGISDYAFQGCATLQSVSFGNNLSTIGNGAFANCIRLSQCNMPVESNIQSLGKDAFYNCTALTSIILPINVKAIGDSCFEGCTRLQKVDLCGGSEDELDTMLQTIGNSAFKNCSSLGEVIFPSQYAESNLQIGVFEGCSNLQRVKVPNSNMDFTDDTSFTFETFKDTVPESFYFWGADTKTDDRIGRSALHVTANEEEIAYKYWDKEVYEVVISEAATGASITYQVNDRNELTKIWIEGNPENVEIPKRIGPYGISTIGTGCFDNACTIKRVTIPETVANIADGAFKGTHNLKTVIFSNASTIQSIGTDAFRTQVVSCGDKITEEDPELTFVGAMINDAGTDTVPFIYAMTPENMINNPDQNKAWITCHSGWPTNLEVKYNYDYTTEEGGAELESYPRYDNFTDAITDPSSGNITGFKSNRAKIEAYVAKLPYVNTSDDTEETYLANVIQEAIDRCEKNDPANLPTEKMLELVNASKNVVVPTNVDMLKKGLFSGYTYKTDSNGEPIVPEEAEVVGTEGPDTYINSITLNGVNTIDPFTFTGCSNLQSAAIIGATELGDYAFGCLEELDSTTGVINSTSENCENLSSVTLGPNIATVGMRPFRGCDKLTNIECLGSNLAYQNGILYDLNNGKKTIAECLPGRGTNVGSYTVGPEEFDGVTDVLPEAFMDCDEIGKVDLSTTTVDTIPDRCFMDTKILTSVVLPDTVKNIEKDAFKNSGLKLLTIPGNQAYIEKDAFESSPQQTINFECVEGTTADRYAKEYDYINPEYGKVYLTHTVTFWDYPDYPDITSKAIYYTTKVKDGEDAVPPTTPPSHDGVAFSRWTDYTNISKDTDVWPIFGSNIYAVSFMDYDGTLIGEVQYIEEGKSATPPANPTREGYTFDKWSQDWNNVTEDRTIIALYIDNSSDASRHTVIFYDYDGKTILSQQSVNDGEAAVEPKSPTRAGYTFLGWVPSDFSKVTKDLNIVANYEKEGSGTSSSANPSGSGSSNGNNNGNNGNGSNASPTPTSSPGANGSDVKKYTVSVSGGSGSGSYAAGAVVAINAYFMGEGQVFDKWTSSTAGVGFANPNASSTTFTMPAANVAITATYKTGSGSANANAANGGSSSSGQNGASSSSNGTKVEITRPGISNTGLAGATVSGATDNFIVKITEDQAATDAVIAALQAEYGDISRLKYLPMDISLYDSTGRTRIADTSGISVNLTLPLPDDLIQYAGNNMAAAVNNGQLEKLNARFTTVDGVPCINFTATHFSPYVIYVDTANLTQATIDATPKTGDPIHPKWFLATGLACISLILFFKRDKKVLPVKTA